VRRDESSNGHDSVHRRYNSVALHFKYPSLVYLAPRRNRALVLEKIVELSDKYAVQ
jgi:hypothetical protein